MTQGARGASLRVKGLDLSGKESLMSAHDTNGIVPEATVGES